MVGFFPQLPLPLLSSFWWKLTRDMLLSPPLGFSTLVMVLGSSMDDVAGRPVSSRGGNVLIGLTHKMALNSRKCCMFFCWLGRYAVWFVASDHLKRSPPSTLPAWPLWFIFKPMWVFLDAIGVHQAAEFEEPLPKGKFMMLCSPHGAYAFSGTTWIGPQFRLALLKEYQHVNLFYAVASVLFYIPVVREIILMMGCREATRSTIVKLALHKTSPCSVAILPGGMYEQICTRHDEERHYVQKRLGFVKLALELGLPMVPMVGFGENQLFTTHYKFGNNFRHWLLSTLSMGVPFITGRFGCTLIPHPITVTHVYGKAVKVAKTENPTEKQIEEAYGRYVAEVTRLFNKHAKRFLPPDVAAKGIRIIRIGVDEDDRAPVQ